jgi:hypothetical protein
VEKEMKNPNTAGIYPLGVPRTPDTPETLCIHGRPGYGKNVLCSHIVYHLSASRDSPDRAVAHYFFSSDHESRNDPYIIAWSWVSQLASQPNIYALVQQKWETSRDQIASRIIVIQLLHEVLSLMVSTNALHWPMPHSVAGFLEDLKNAITPSDPGPGYKP